MDEQKSGGPAFPFPHREFVDRYDAGMRELCRDMNIGMSLRDYFAAKALEGLFAGREKMAWFSSEGWLSNCQQMAINAYAAADSMLKAREGKA